MTEINKQELPSNVIDLLKWKKPKLIREENAKSWPDSVEGKNISEIRNLGWDTTKNLHLTDTLYSFLSIYAIGVWVYNKDTLQTVQRIMTSCLTLTFSIWTREADLFQELPMSN